MEDRMYSFDVFDTLITRKTATPKGIFALMQQELQTNAEYASFPPYVKANFYDLRVNVEDISRETYRNQGFEDIIIDKIYEGFSLLGSLSNQQIKALIELENHLELQNSIGIRTNIDKVKLLIKQGERVVLLSDMYLRESIIRKMLVKEDAVFSDLTIYVSAEYGKTKYSGSLYRFVKEQENVEYAEWIHLGDNYNVDVRQAKALGIQAEHIRFPNLEEWEKKALASLEKDVQVQLMIGSARNVRMENNLSFAGKAGASIGGSILFSYIWWILQSSLEMQIKRLYFIARDGYLLQKMADIIIKEMGYEIRTSYIYGSREAWRAPSISERNQDLKKLVYWSHQRSIRSLDKLAEVFQIKTEELLCFLPYGCRFLKEPMAELALKQLVLHLNDNQKFIQFLIEKNKDKRMLVRDYLMQEIDLSDDKFAFVDLSGSGLTQGCLNDILRDFTNTPIRSFFFRMDQMGVADNCIFYDFIPGRIQGSLIMEMFCRAPHGQTKGYEKRGGKIVPVFRDGDEKELEAHGYLDFVKGAEMFTQNFIRLLPDIQYENRIALTLTYLKDITRTPSGEVLEYFAGMPNGVTGRERKIEEYAPKLSRKELKLLYLIRTREPIEYFYKYSRLDYSLLRCDKKDVKYIEFCKNNHDNFIGKFARINKGIKLKPEKKFGRAAGFPCEILERNIILYGGGKFGCDLRKKIIRKNNINIVQWVDKSFKDCRANGLDEVISPDQIGKVPYEQVVIAVLNAKIAVEIKQELLQSGVPENKLLWIDFNKEKYYVNWNNISPDIS